MLTFEELSARSMQAFYKLYPIRYFWNTYVHAGHAYLFKEKLQESFKYFTSKSKSKNRNNIRNFRLLNSEIKYRSFIANE